MLERRPELLASLGVALVSAGVLMGSLTAAFRTSPENKIHAGSARLPTSVFVREDQGAVAPVEAVIAQEILEPAPEPSPTARATRQRSRTGPSQGSSGPEAGVGLTLKLSGEASRGSRTVVYKGEITNSGGSQVDSLVLQTHIPGGTSWYADPSCPDTQTRVTVTGADGAQRRWCVGQSGSQHELILQIHEAIAPGATVQVSFVFDSGHTDQKSVVEHFHVTAAGRTFDSPESVVELK